MLAIAGAIVGWAALFHAVWGQSYQGFQYDPARLLRLDSVNSSA